MPELDTIPTLRQRTRASFKEILKAQETKEVAAFLTSQFVAFLVFMSLRQIFPLYLEKSTGEDWGIRWGIIVAAYTFGGIITRVPSGYLIEKIGRKTLVISSYIIMTLTAGALAFTKNLALLSILWIILRTSNNIFGLTSRSLLSDLETKYKGFYNSIISTSGRFGSLIGIVSLGVLLEFFQPYVMIIFVFVLSIIGGVLFILLYTKGKGEEKYIERRNEMENGEKTKLRVQEFKNRIFIFFFIAFLIFGVMEGFTNPQFSLYGYNIINFSESLVGTILGLSNISFIIVGPVIGFAISHRKQLIDYMLVSACILLTLNFLMIFLFPTNPGVYIAFLFIRSAGHALFFPVVMTILTSVLSKNHFALLFSIITTAFFLGVATTSYASGVLLAKNISYFWLSSLVTAAVLTILILSYLITIQKRIKNGKAAPLDFAGLK